jgi:arabinose-5-phosphate isomerase
MTAAHCDVSVAEKTVADLEAARRVLSVEGDALAALARTLDHRFTKAIDIIMGVEGRVIISGMGKSGLIGAKIAATMSSLGLPAHFMHPSEAVHGDLGRVRTGDVAILMSYSGGTEEVVNLAAILRTHGDAYLATHPALIRPQMKAWRAIQACSPPGMGLFRAPHWVSLLGSKLWPTA